MPSRTPFSAQKNFVNLSLVVRNPRLKTAAIIDMITLPAATTVQLSGQLVSEDYSERVPILLNMKQSDLAQISTRATHRGGEVFLDSDGTDSGYRLKDLHIVNAADGVTDTMTGVFISDDGREYPFAAMMDPAPAAAAAVVVIAKVAVAAIAVCGLAFIISQFVGEGKEILKDGIDACQEGGGLPEITVTVGFGFSWRPLKVLCGKDCILKCQKG